jgi:LacI family transcriptional regulator
MAKQTRKIALQMENQAVDVDGSGTGRTGRRITLRAIAEKVGVSRMTVSLALRDDPRVAKATRRKILATAQKMGFCPDAQVGKLMSELARLRKTRNYQGELAFLTGWESEHGWQSSFHFSECFRGAQKRALELGYRLTPFWTRDPKYLTKRLSRILWARNIRGILIAPVPAEVAGLPYGQLNFDWQRFCLIHLGATLVKPELNIVRHNHFHGMHYALERMEKYGYRRIGFAIIETGDILSARLWTAAYLHWRNRRGFDRDLPGLVYAYGQHSTTLLCDWIRAHQIEAVVAMEGRLYSTIKQIEKSLDRHIGFCVLDHPGDDSPFAGIEQNALEIGRVAIDQLVHAINHNQLGPPEHPSQTLIQGEWHSADSTRKTPGRPRPASILKTKFISDHF